MAPFGARSLVNGRYGNPAIGGPNRTRTPSGRLIVALAGIVVATPVFVSVGAGGLGFGQPQRTVFRTDQNGVDVALSSILLPAFWIWGWNALRRDSIARERLILVAVAAVLAAAFGIVLASGGLLGLLYVYQTLIPLAAFAVAYRASALGLGRVLITALVLTITTFTVLHLVLTFISGLDPVTGVQGGHRAWNNSKILRFFPSAAALAAVASLVAPRLLVPSRLVKRFGWLLAVPNTLLVLLSHSRTALLMIVFTVVLLVFSGARRHLRRSAVALTAFAGVALAVAFTSATSVTRLTSGTGSEADDRRMDAWLNSLLEGVSTPFGRGFSATVDVSTAGQAVAINRIAISENQIGEYLVRGGPLLLLAVGLLVALAVRRADPGHASHPNAASSPDPEALRALLIVSVIGTSLTQLSLTETYLAPILWAMVGLAAGLHERVSPRGRFGDDAIQGTARVSTRRSSNRICAVGRRVGP